ncbi:MAG: HAD family hydrolase [bacterium]
MYQVICFDLDGTLVDSITDIGNSMNMVLQHHKLPTRSYDDYRNFIGNGSRKLVERASGYFKVDEMLEQYNNLYYINSTKTTKEYADVTKVLLHLKSHYKLVVITNKPHNLAVKIVSHYFKDIFDLVIGQQPDVPAKPRPDMMDIVIRNYKLRSKTKILYVGDSEVDHNFAINSKVDHYIVTHGYGQDEFIYELDKKYKINNLKEILNKLK